MFLPKKPTPSELENKKVVRKSIVAIKSIKRGEKFTHSNISVKRPSTGISPLKFKKLIGKKSSKKYFLDDLIKERI